MDEFHPRFGKQCRLWAWSGRWTRIVTPPLRPPSNRDPARGGALRRLSDGDKRQSRERRIRQRSPRARCRELSPNPASKVSTSNRAFGFKIKFRPKRLSLASALGAGTCPSYGGYVATKSSGVAQTSQTQGRPSGISYRPNKRGVHMKKLFLGSVALVALGLVAGGIRCRKAGAIYATAAAGSGLHLDRLLCRCERGDIQRPQRRVLDHSREHCSRTRAGRYEYPAVRHSTHGLL